MFPVFTQRLLQTGSHFYHFSLSSGLRFISGIASYKEEYYPAVLKIAMDNLPRLVSLEPHEDSSSRYAKRQQNKLFSSEVKPLLQAEHCIVSLAADTPVAFLTRSTSHWTPKTREKSIGYIEHLATDSAWRKSGHGSKLMNYALEQFEKEGVRFVRVSVTDRGLLQFYYKFGFKTDFDLPSKTNTYVSMMKKLGPPAESTAKRAADYLVMNAEKIHHTYLCLAYLLACGIVVYLVDSNMKNEDTGFKINLSKKNGR